MKSTIKLSKTRSVTVQPSKSEPGHVSVIFENTASAIGQFGVNLTPDQAGALIFALEQVCEANELAAERAAA